ncbi:MAG: hypothetical protein WCG93_03955 [Paludibacter sp.]
MIFNETLSAELANQLFNDNEKTLKFIADAKWEDGFVCRKCANTNGLKKLGDFNVSPVWNGLGKKIMKLDTVHGGAEYRVDQM